MIEEVNADRNWVWQFVFPSDRISQAPRSGIIRRHHLHESGLQKAVKQAIKMAGRQLHNCQKSDV